MRDLVLSPSWNAVAAGQTASVSLPVGNLTYHRLLIEVGMSNTGGGSKANLETYISQIRLNLNGKVQRRMSASQLDSINAYHGKPNNGSGFLEIYFSEPWLRTAEGEDALAWGMADIATFTVEMDLAAGITAPTIQLHSEIERIGRNNGYIKKWRPFQAPIVTTGIFSQNSLPKDAAYSTIHCFNGTTADIADVEVMVDGLSRYKATNAETVENLTNYGNVPQSNMFHLDFARTKRVADALSMISVPATNNTPAVPVQDFTIRWDMANATPFTEICEVIGLRD